MRVDIEKVPLEIRRRVANQLEAIRGTPMAPRAAKMQLGETVCPIYRPDVKGVAYWEFEITGLTGVRSREHDGKSSGLGFIIASTGTHDVPIPHWSLTMEAPSHALAAKSPEVAIAKVYKLDALSYSAEDSKGTHVANVGRPLPKISGIPTDRAKWSGIATATAIPKVASQDDSTVSKHVLRTEGAKSVKLELTGWKTWSDTKKGFAKTYRPHLDALASHAAGVWKTESLISQFGEGILEGQSLTIPLLKPGKFQVTGEAQKFLKVQAIETGSGAVKMTALPTGDTKELNFQLNIAYRDGSSESLPFFIVPKGTPSNSRSVLPHLTPIDIR